MGVEVEELLTLARRIAADAGALLIDGLRRPRSEVGTKTSGTDMVTEMDRASEALIVDAIRSARPGDGILSEEGAAADTSSGVRWVVDPIDGTTNYLYRMPGFSVSIAVEIDGRVMVGVVNDPMNGEEFTAIRGRGARRNGEVIAPTAESVLAQALVGTGFGYAAERRSQQAQVLTHVLDRVRDIRRVGGASLDLCWVACGRFDAYYEWDLKHWDIAAGLLVAEEAGAVTGPIEGIADDLLPTLVAAPGVYDAVYALVTEAVSSTGT
jgi:myo-inositol-1(or 4)-monophosphatase